MHVPLIVSYPKEIPSDVTFTDNLTLIDVFPTILDYSGIAQGDYLEGKSLRRLIDGKSKKNNLVYSEGGYRKSGKYHSVIYQDNWKLIHFSKDKWELYDIKSDPAEQKNLISSNATFADILKKKLLAWESNDKAGGNEEKVKVDYLSEETRKQLKLLGYID